MDQLLLLLRNMRICLRLATGSLALYSKSAAIGEVVMQDAREREDAQNESWTEQKIKDARQITKPRPFSRGRTNILQIFMKGACGTRHGGEWLNRCTETSRGFGKTEQGSGSFQGKH